MCVFRLISHRIVLYIYTAVWWKFGKLFYDKVTRLNRLTIYFADFHQDIIRSDVVSNLYSEDGRFVACSFLFEINQTLI